MIGDLHCHTRLSDGSCSIDDVIFYAKRAGLNFLSLTDHDTMDGVVRAGVLGRRYGLRIIPGVELSCFDQQRDRPVHLLCYLPDKPDRLQGLMARTLESRGRAAKRMVRAVTRYYPVTGEHIARYALGSKSVCEVHIMQALMDLGYDCQSHGALYTELFSPGSGLCAARPELPDIYTVLDAVHDAGGLAVLAHPPVLDSMELLKDLAEKELLDGVELYHPKVRGEAARAVADVARRHQLITTGGSGFHGCWTGTPNPLASCVAPEESVRELFRRAMPVK